MWFSSIKMTPKARKKLEEIDKFILLYPKIQNIRVTEAQFEELKKCLPLHQQQDGSERLLYDSRFICKA